MNKKGKLAFFLLIMLGASSLLAIAPVESQPNNTYTAYGPIGTGPYIYMGTDSATGAIKLVRNENYWNKDALQQTGAFGVQEFDLQYINGTNAAVAALTAGNVSIISPYYRIDDFTGINAPWGDFVSAYAGDVVQMDINLQHPVFGTGIDTPIGRENASRAAEAALYVRQAISHLIPRQEIVDTAFGGVAMPGVISGLSPMTTGFDSTLEPYSYNVTLARQLLTQAGYDPSNNSILFNMTLQVGAGAEATNTIALLVQNNLRSVGIAADLSVVNFNNIIDRIFPDSTDKLGKTYDQGGFYGTNSTPYFSYDSSQIPPNGGNGDLWNNTENDRLCSLIEHATNETERIEYLTQWQQLFYNEQPTIVIVYPKEVIAFNPATLEKTPFEVYFPSMWPVAQNWVLKQATAQTKITMAVPQRIPMQGFNPFITGNSYDYEVCSEIFENLATINDSISKTIVPALATSWASSADKTTWTVYLRENVTWHDGVRFNATDVKFTYAAAISSEVGNTWLNNILGSADNIQVVNEYTVKFTLPLAYPNFVSDILTVPILPSHVLQNVEYNNWKTHPFNTAASSYVVTLPQVTSSPSATATSATSFFDQYGIYTLAIVIVIVVIVGLVFVFRQRSKAKAKK
jgi:ABC-type transport system substrate-binding protein